MSAKFSDNRTVLVSTDAGGGQANDSSRDPAVSENGRYVAFWSFASDLVPGDANGTSDVFVKDLRTGVLTLVSANASGEAGNGLSSAPSISADGRYVAFESLASDLVPGDANGRYDVFVKDLRTGALALVSADAEGNQGDGGSFGPSISDSGRHVAFFSSASDLVPGDTNGNFDVFLKDLRTGAVTLVSANAGGEEGDGFSSRPSISADGRYVAFDSFASNLVPGDANGTSDIFVKDLRTGAVTLVSANAGGEEGNGYSVLPSISDNGRYVAFASFASDLVPGDANGTTDVFVKDLRTGTLALVSAGPDGNAGNGFSVFPAISGNGRYVAFESAASDLVAGDANGETDIFLKDLRTGAVTLVSADPEGNAGNAFSIDAYVTDRGAVAFASAASNLVPGDANDAYSDVFIWA